MVKNKNPLKCHTFYISLRINTSHFHIMLWCYFLKWPNEISPCTSQNGDLKLRFGTFLMSKLRDRSAILKGYSEDKLCIFLYLRRKNDSLNISKWWSKLSFDNFLMSKLMQPKLATHTKYITYRNLKSRLVKTLQFTSLF